MAYGFAGFFYFVETILSVNLGQFIVGKTPNCPQ